MDIIIYSEKDSWIHRLDPRARILAACMLSLVLSLSQSGATLFTGLCMGGGAAVAARIPIAALLQRLVPLNALLALLSFVLLFFTPGDSLFQVGTWGATWNGMYEALHIGLKANAIVLLLAALLGTIELVDLGHALGRLHVPAKLAHLLLFTVRYMGLMLSEFERLSRAAQLRGFRPGPNRHTLRTTGYLVGMILVRSYVRGERVLNAMRLRGYQGSLSFPGEMAFQRADAAFGVMVAGAALLLWGVARL